MIEWEGRMRAIALATAIGLASMSCKERTEPQTEKKPRAPDATVVTTAPASTVQAEPKKAVKISETSDIAAGKAKVYRLNLPRGSEATLEVHVSSGPGIDVHVMDEANYQVYSKGLINFREVDDLKSVGTVDYQRETTLGPGTWHIVTHAPSTSGKLVEALVIDAAENVIVPGSGVLKAATDVAKHEANEPVSRVEVKLNIAEKPIPIGVPRKAKVATPIEQSLDVEAHKELIYTLTIPEGSTPGRLMGTWTSAGKSASIKGANDDTLVSFQIKGPNNEELATHQGHKVTGNFSVSVLTPGAYTFVFNNSGVLRSSARHVTVKGSYQQE